jgi:beta-lactamase class D
MYPSFAAFPTAMRSFLALCVTAVLAAACGHAPKVTPETSGAVRPTKGPFPSPTRVEENRHGAEMIKTAGFRGTFVLYDDQSQRWTATDPHLAEERYLPASTFKIPNALIALQTGVATGEDFLLRWDGKVRDREELNRDHTLASAMKVSAVWYFQELARRVGEPRMRALVTAFDYGNQDLSAGVDQFWLHGGFGISALEQVRFIGRMKAGELPVDAAHVATVEKITTLATGRDKDAAGQTWTLRGKTGMYEDSANAHGWLVGSVERAGRTHIYALLLVGRIEESKRIMGARKDLTRALLDDAHVLPASY